MATNKKTEGPLESLDKEIRRLQKKAKRLEDQIDYNFSYLQRHSAVMVINSLFPPSGSGAEDRGMKGMLGGLLENEKLSGLINKLANKLIKRASDFINKLIDKWID